MNRRNLAILSFPLSLGLLAAGCSLAGLNRGRFPDRKPMGRCSDACELPRRCVGCSSRRVANGPWDPFQCHVRLLYDRLFQTINVRMHCHVSDNPGSSRGLK